MAADNQPRSHATLSEAITEALRKQGTDLAIPGINKAIALAATAALDPDILQLSREAEVIDRLDMAVTESENISCGGTEKEIEEYTRIVSAITDTTYKLSGLQEHFTFLIPPLVLPLVIGEKILKDPPPLSDAEAKKPLRPEVLEARLSARPPIHPKIVAALHAKKKLLRSTLQVALKCAAEAGECPAIAINDPVLMYAIVQAKDAQALLESKTEIEALKHQIAQRRSSVITNAIDTMSRIEAKTQTIAACLTTLHPRMAEIVAQKVMETSDNQHDVNNTSSPITLFLMVHAPRLIKAEKLNSMDDIAKFLGALWQIKEMEFEKEHSDPQMHLDDNYKNELRAKYFAELTIIFGAVGETLGISKQIYAHKAKAERTQDVSFVKSLTPWTERIAPGTSSPSPDTTSPCP